jgi:glycosyltransferase involved in cell wall biosynthesis
MRMLVISNLYPPAHVGGYEVLCAEAVRCLAERHEITVLTSDHQGVPSEPGIVRELAYLPMGTRHTLRAPSATVHAARVTRRLVDEVRPEFVFVWNGAAMPQAAIRIAEQSGAAVAYSVCEGWFGGLYTRDRFMRDLAHTRPGLRGLWGRGMRALNRHPALRLEIDSRVPASICWVSDALRRQTPLPPTVEPLEQQVIYTGVHEPALWSSVERRPGSGPPLIAFVGRLEAEKGPDVAYRALAALRDRHGIDATLALAGRADPEMDATLRALARELRIADRLRLLGQVDQPRVAQLMAEASAIVVPSVWEEPSGGICLEAGLARVPVVASRSGGMPEGLLEEEHALYFPIADHDACADCLARVLGDPADAEARAARAFERAQLFTFDRYMAQMNEFVETAAKPPRPALRRSPA